MSQRNPMNDRYQTDDRKGQTRKSAASAKPKTRAAASVRVQSNTKSPKEKKAVQKQERAKHRQLEAKYYNPDTAEFKKWRRIWWAMLIAAIAMTGISLLLRVVWPEWEIPSLVVLGVGYVGIVGALIIDFTKIRKMRREYQAEMQAKISKEERAVAKKEHAAKVAAKKAAAEKAESAEAGIEEGESLIQKRQSLFSIAGLKSITARSSKENKAGEAEDEMAKKGK